MLVSIDSELTLLSKDTNTGVKDKRLGSVYNVYMQKCCWLDQRGTKANKNE